MIFSKQKLYQCRNKPSRYLANLLNPKAKKTRINTLITSKGEEVHTEMEKLTEFVNFYSRLYQSSSTPEIEIKIFLNNLNTEKTTTVKFQVLEAIISRGNKISYFQHERKTSPGSNGITIEFYKTFIQELSTVLVTLFKKVYMKKRCQIHGMKLTSS